nr:tRNA (adenosine(37)-N6)-threonylcarbamoyltransferase complex ATPase subunit type 1 TsaE [bacterium]
MTQRVICHTLEDTKRAAAQLAGRLAPGSCVAMDGDLGAGKTAFFGFVAEALGACGQASSPTYVLMQVYTGGKMPVYHFDLYRLADEEAVEELGLDEYFSADGVALIEWPGAAGSLLPPNTLRGAMRRLEGDAREIVITGPIDAMEGWCAL